MDAGIRKPGEFCWINMITPEPERARGFFARVLGWTYFEMPGMGYGMQVGGRNIGGLFDIAGPNAPPGLSPMIGVMVKVESADDAAEKVRALGGEARAPFDVLDSGRMAVCHDPNGAQFDLWEPKAKPGTDVDSRLHGAPSWFENMTTDVERAKGFYAELFGWTPGEPTSPGGIPYTVFRHDGRDVAGMMAITPAMEGHKPAWTTYFTVDDPDEAGREAVALGGKLCVDMHDVPGVGRFCGITSPQGVPFSVIKYAC